MNVIPLQQASQDFNQVFERLVQDTEPTIVSSAEGKSIVLLTLEEFNALRETYYLQSDPTNLAWLKESYKQYQSGTLINRSINDLMDV